MAMNAEQALADLTEISSQIQAAVLFDREGTVTGSTLAAQARAEELASIASQVFRNAEHVKPTGTLTQLEIATGEGSLFVVRDDATYIAATTGSNPTVGLVFYDLKSTLRNLKREPEPEPKEAPAAPDEPTTATRKTSSTKPKKTATAGSKKKTAARKPATRKKTDEP